MSVASEPQAHDNGSGPADQALIGKIVPDLRIALVQAEKRAEEVEAKWAKVEAQAKAEIREAVAEAKRIERTIKYLTGEPLRAPNARKPGPRPKGVRMTTPAGTRITISDVRVAAIEKVIREIATTEGDEFRQLDVRTRMDIRSGETANGFEVLRQRGVIRLARQSGNNKYYRMTREALQK